MFRKLIAFLVVVFYRLISQKGLKLKRSKISSKCVAAVAAATVTKWSMFNEVEMKGWISFNHYDHKQRKKHNKRSKQKVFQLISTYFSTHWTDSKQHQTGLWLWAQSKNEERAVEIGEVKLNEWLCSCSMIIINFLFNELLILLW